MCLRLLATRSQCAAAGLKAQVQEGMAGGGDLKDRGCRVGGPARVGFVLCNSGTAEAGKGGDVGPLHLHGMCQAAARGHDDAVLGLGIARTARLHRCQVVGGLY